MKKLATVGYVYLLHFDRPFGHAKHYTGWAADVDHRIGEHMDGVSHSANLVRKAAADGIGFAVARVWPNKTRNDERAMKKQGGASRRCPLCAMGETNGTRTAPAPEN
jgi:predicted GIY-YIG superfamily endonuclease